MTCLDRPTVAAVAVNLLARRTRYLEAEMLGLPDLVRPGSVCVDVGAAAGLYTPGPVPARRSRRAGAQR
jgi:hypothetical protein